MHSVYTTSPALSPRLTTSVAVTFDAENIVMLHQSQLHEWRTHVEQKMWRLESVG